MRTRFQLVNMLTAILVALFLGIHMVRLHLDDILKYFGIHTGDPTSWDSMIHRATDGVWAGIYIALLAVALYHALYGLRGIILELTPSAKAGQVTTWCLVAIGVAAFGWGTYVPIHLLSG
jgi:succinate dehydrogenase hydrophobic anchor subunit